MRRTTECRQSPEEPRQVDGEKLRSIGRNAERSKAFGRDGDRNRIATRDGDFRDFPVGLGSHAKIKSQPVGRFQNLRLTILGELDVVRYFRQRHGTRPEINEGSSEQHQDCCESQRPAAAQNGPSRLRLGAYQCAIPCRCWKHSRTSMRSKIRAPKPRLVTAARKRQSLQPSRVAADLNRLESPMRADISAPGLFPGIGR